MHKARIKLLFATPTLFDSEFLDLTNNCKTGGIGLLVAKVV